MVEDYAPLGYVPTCSDEGTATMRFARTRADKREKLRHEVPAAQTIADPAAGPTPGPAERGADDIEDWDDLFRVIRKRLGEMDDDPLSQSPGRWSAGAQSRVSPALLKCVAALHLLHPSVIREMRRHDQIEREVIDAHCAFPRVGGDLTGPR